MDKELEKKIDKALKNETPTIKKYVKLLAERPENHVDYEVVYYTDEDVEGKMTLQRNYSSTQWVTRDKLKGMANEQDTGILLCTDLVDADGYHKADVLVFNTPEARKRKGSFEIRKKIAIKKREVERQMSLDKLFTKITKEVGKDNKRCEIHYTFSHNEDADSWSVIQDYEWKDEKKTPESAEKFIKEQKKAYEKAGNDAPVYKIVEINEKIIKVIK
jgi:hypothetical protein